MDMDFQLEEFTEGDVMRLTPVMKRAFDEDTRRHLGEDAGGPPGYDDGSFLRTWALHEKSTAFVVIREGRPVGAVILWINPDGDNSLGCIFLDPACQDKGLGTRIWRAIERRFPETRVWKTGTPGFSKRNHHFYMDKCGFQLTAIINPGDRREEGYQFEKRMK